MLEGYSAVSKKIWYFLAFNKRANTVLLSCLISSHAFNLAFFVLCGDFVSNNPTMKVKVKYSVSNRAESRHDRRIGERS